MKPCNALQGAVHGKDTCIFFNVQSRLEKLEHRSHCGDSICLVLWHVHYIWLDSEKWDEWKRYTLHCIRLVFSAVLSRYHGTSTSYCLTLLSVAILCSTNQIICCMYNFSNTHWCNMLRCLPTCSLWRWCIHWHHGVPIICASVPEMFSSDQSTTVMISFF